MRVAPRARFATPPDLRAARRAARQHGCIRSDQLAACGLARAAVVRRVRKGWLHRVHTGVYAVGCPISTLHGRFMAAVLAGGPGAFLSHWASCAIAGLVRWDGRRIDVTAPGDGHRRRSGIRFHRSRSIEPRDVTRRHGIPSTTAARALLEIAPRLSDRRLKRAVRQAQVERLASVDQIADITRRANGHPGAARIAAIIASGPAPTASGDEDSVLDLILQAGFEHPVVNAPRSVGARTYYPDLRWPAERLILEIDSSPWHDGPLARELDGSRQAELEGDGERVLRTTREQALQDRAALVARLDAAGAPRAPAPAPPDAPATDRPAQAAALSPAARAARSA
ncbi:MAG TPA: type IV toxin-antitoxin system AbiEi family antitoxin domain-containing protein [Solirubrobacteraceae bacterium]|nr:type IV toxin-antitoxin system AbiEi family antitoxin domain-containing protein [Solirubrobacteraceae bacterium]